MTPCRSSTRRGPASAQSRSPIPRRWRSRRSATTPMSLRARRTPSPSSTYPRWPSWPPSAGSPIRRGGTGRVRNTWLRQQFRRDGVGDRHRPGQRELQHHHRHLHRRQRRVVGVRPGGVIYVGDPAGNGSLDVVNVSSLFGNGGDGGNGGAGGSTSGDGGDGGTGGAGSASAAATGNVAGGDGGDGGDSTNGIAGNGGAGRSGTSAGQARMSTAAPGVTVALPWETATAAWAVPAVMRQRPLPAPTPTAVTAGAAVTRQAPVRAVRAATAVMPPGWTPMPRAATVVTAATPAVPVTVAPAARAATPTSRTERLWL